MTVVNEKLATNPHGEFSEIFKRLGVPYEESPINYLQNNVINSSFKSATHLPHKVEPWKQWTPEQKEIFLGEAGNGMKQYRIAQDDWYLLRKSPVYRLIEDVQQQD